MDIPTPGSRRRPYVTQEVMQAVRRQLDTGTLVGGDRLPSIRQLAAQLRVSPSTVVEAYDRLSAEGLIRARPGSGFYVSAGHPPIPAVAARPPHADPLIDPFWVSRQALDAAPSALKPGCGWLPPDWMPLDALRRSCRALARSQDAAPLVDYGTTRGPQALRRLLQVRLSGHGIETARENLLLAGSATHALDLVCRLLLRPGDTVLVDDPCYFNFRTTLQAHRAKVLGVRHTPDGPDLAAFSALLDQHAPRLYLTNASLHNPTGATLSAQSAHRLLKAAAAHGLIVVEDDIFADFAEDPAPQLAALDGLENVLRIGSFSKTLSASARCGYIAARAEWIDGLAELQIATGFGGPGRIATELLTHALTSGGYRKHMEALRRRLARARREAAMRLRRIGIEPWLMPSGGFYLWCRLPDNRDATEVARRALAENMVLAPGNVFSTTGTATSFMRFNVAHCSDPGMFQTLRRALSG